ncbi:MAG TPA: SDR family NAD(P)-dependent oxidoreductase [Bryobacteraceae bacterium]|nr:SDR family NAD(P)-dependent oxidoreductase [Bryobacteraceae bacterium]
MSVLITGAAGGLGSVVVEAFLSTGAEVYGTDLTWKRQPHSHPRFHPITANLTEAARQAAPVDTLLHLVGGFAGGQSVAETPDETWDKMIDLNLRSAYTIFRAVLPGMIKAGKGRIVAVGARAALDPMANFAAYSVTKTALVALVKTVALEVKDNGVTVNAVLPSVIDTPANRAAMPAADPSKWVTPQSIAGLLLWLASDAARDISGAAIPIYGRA